MRVEGGAEGFDPGFSRFKAGDDALFEEAGDEELHLELGGVEGLAGAVVAFFNHGAEGFELAQALTDGALADLETLRDLLHGQGLLVGEEKSEDFAIRLRVAEKFSQVGEDGYQAGFVISGEDGAGGRERRDGCGGRRIANQLGSRGHVDELSLMRANIKSK